MEHMNVNISYAQLDSISISSKFTTVAYAKSLKETQSQDRQGFILGNPQGEENPTKLPMYKMYKIKPQNKYSPPCWYVSLSPIH